MKKIHLYAAAILVALVPAVIGLAGNASFSQSVPVRSPVHQGAATHTSTKAPTTTSIPKPSQSATHRSRGGHEAEPGDDHGRGAEPGDDHGREAEPGDDHGREAEPGDDRGNDGAGHDVGDDHGGRSGRDGTGSSTRGSTSSSSNGGSGGSGTSGSHSGGSHSGSPHSGDDRGTHGHGSDD